MSDINSKLFNKIPTIKKLVKAVMEANCEHPPVFFTSSEDENIEVKPVAFRNNRDKDKVMSDMKARIQDGSVKEYVFVAESWSLEAEKDGVEKAFNEYGSVADHPLRKEIMLMQYSSAKDEILYKADIIRSGGNVSLGEWETFSTKSADKKASTNSGRFNDMFGKAMAEFN